MSLDTLFSNGRIWTADPTCPWAQAVGVAQGRIVAVGHNEDVAALADAGTKKIDLAGRMAMPGIQDVHLHLMFGGRQDLYQLEFSAKTSFEGILERVAEAAADKPGTCIFGGGWGNDARIGQLEGLDALDRASAGTPVILFDESHHNYWANRKAMEIAGVTPQTADPQGGAILRDPASGAMTGVFLETAKDVFAAALAEAFPRSVEREDAAALRALQILHSYGVTGFQEAASTPQVMATMQRLDRQGRMSAWAVASLAYAPFDDDAGYGEDLWETAPQFASERIFPTFSKFFLDGVPPLRTAAFIEPYLPGPDGDGDNRGDLYYTTDELARLLARSEDAGLAAKMHCTGDASVHQALNAIEMVRKKHPERHFAHHIAHASYILPKDIPRFAQLGVVADLCPMFWVPSATLEGCIEVLGEERARRFWPIRDLHEAGTLLAAGTDWPVVPRPDPWIGLEGMITRKNPSGEYEGTLWPEQALGLDQALRAYTVDAARAMRIGHLTGSLRPGLSADLIVLDRNLFDGPPEAISDTRVLMTWARGQLVHEG